MQMSLFQKGMFSFRLLFSIVDIVISYNILLLQNSPYNEESQIDSSPTSEKLLPIELIEVKAKGRFGEVWKALNKNRNEHVAVKIVPEEVSS